MPLLVGNSIVVPGSSELQPVWSEDFGSITATWTDPEGTVWPLSNISPETGWFTTERIGGWGARPYTFTTDPLPRGGVSVRFIRPEPAIITWPLHIYSDDSHVEFLQRYRAIRRAFMMTVHRNLTGTLTVQRPDGSSRVIDCYYEDGFKGEPGEMWRSANPVLTLMAPDGYWRDPIPVTVVRKQETGVDFLAGLPAVSSSQVLGATTVFNPGDVQAWPSWVITGPATSLTAVSNTTGYSFTLTYTLTAGQQATIQTLTPQVRGPAGQNLVGNLNFPSAFLWPLQPGNNAVTFTVAGSGAGTQIELDFNPRYEGA